MKKIFITIMLLTAICSSFAQTIIWKKKAELPKGYYCGEAISLNNEIYLVVGRDDVSTSSFFYKFNPQKNQWEKLADIPNPATNLALAAVNEKIYAIGGDKFQNTNREYNPQTNTWKIMEPMPTARQHIDCGVYENKIHIAGGLTSWKSITKKHEVYDVAKNTWSEKVSIPSLRNNAAVVTVDSLIYVIGGAGTKEDIWGDIKSVETYNINSDKWEKRNDLPILLFKPASIVVNKILIVLGGQSLIDGENDCSKKVFIYKPQADRWIETTPLPAKNVFFGCTSLENKIYVIGGTVGGNPNWESYSTVYEGELITDNYKDQ
jgi:N-acetylneuraminic acid mutarotase